MQAFSRRCHECVNRRPHAYRTRRTAPNAPIDSRRRIGPRASHHADRARRPRSFSPIFVGKLVDILGAQRSIR
ncbi:hypothetical protein E2R25_04265 [Burkholderia pseudomallei]|nr:hypothetical protein EXY72_04210 [Burkholderia pseudomallei]QBP47633.1 hypothetical protein E2R28_04250 [Burkholderia pseudomallei]QBP67542.1 hypothetical protein E2R25_04265 [Burkholderia pseudomallei]QBR23016.1 hypothetical protein E3O37_04235 [Burkholderia pseudomallei]